MVEPAGVWKYSRQVIGVDRTMLYELIAPGEMAVVKLSNSTGISTASLHELVMRQRGPK